MKKLFWCLAVCLFAVMMVPAAVAQTTPCRTIQDGGIFNPITNEEITVEKDKYGYKYQAHKFNGSYCDSLYNKPFFCSFMPPDAIEMMMIWNDAFWSNEDCDYDGYLDRHYGHASYRGSGAWYTNHQVVSGEDRSLTRTIKAVAIPEDAQLGMDYTADPPVLSWYTAGWELLGKVAYVPLDEWGSFTNEFYLAQEVNNSPSMDWQGMIYKAPVGPGLGQHIEIE